MPRPVLLLLLLAAAAPAPDKADVLRRLQAAEHERLARLDEGSKAAGLLAEARTESAHLSAERVRAAAALRLIENRVVDAEQRLQAARDRSADAKAALAKRQADIETLIPLMMRLARFPAETVIAVPLPPKQALEGLLIIRGLSAQLAQETAELRGMQTRAEQLGDDVHAQAERLAAERAAQASAAAALDRQIATNRTDVTQAERKAMEADEQAAALAAQAETLRGVIAAMEAAHARALEAARADARLAQKRHQKASAEAAAATLAALARPQTAGPGRATMLTPVAGPVLRAWGSPGVDGPATGVTFGAAPGAFVSSPCAGRVAFAAPFRSYGRLLIIECTGGGDVVLAGLERLDAPVGRHVGAGEPVGRMPDYDPGKTRDRPGLYMELRGAGLGQPQDPVPFLKARS